MLGYPLLFAYSLMLCFNSSGVVRSPASNQLPGLQADIEARYKRIDDAIVKGDASGVATVVQEMVAREAELIGSDGLKVSGADFDSSSYALAEHRRWKCDSAKTEVASIDVRRSGTRVHASEEIDFSAQDVHDGASHIHKLKLSLEFVDEWHHVGVRLLIRKRNLVKSETTTSG